MRRWLLKTEPGTYAWADLVREGRTAWTGVANPQAQANLRAMAAGDAAAVYHTGSEKAAVGIAEVVRAAYPERGAQGRMCVDLAPQGPLASPVPLSALKAERAFAGSALVRQGRLSVVPLDEAQWKALLDLAGRGRSPIPARRKPVRPSTTLRRKARPVKGASRAARRGLR